MKRSTFNRMVQEKVKLDRKRARLADFKQTDQFANLPALEQELLNTQAHFMTAYSCVLGERIELVVITDEDEQ